ncbi:MAG: M56 family metallopeptidase, partial [Thermoguttaceae bacterium]|nr:M56 family metallopeptidase [Thermoguttaceae bacterium]
MLEFLCYLASQTLRGSFYIVFMLTLQRLLRNQLSPRVRAALWAPLLIALLAPEICVVRVPVSQPVETTVVDALEQTRAAFVPDSVSDDAAAFGLRRVDGRAVVYLPPSPLELGPFKTIAPPFENVGRVEQILREIRDETQEASFSNDESFADVEETPPFEFESSEPLEFSESFATDLPEPTEDVLAPTVADVAQVDESGQLNAEPDVSSESVASLAPARLEETRAQLEDATRRQSVPPTRPVDRRAGWFAFFQVAGIVAVALWAFGLVVAFVYLVRSAVVCQRWIRFSAPIDDADVLALYRRCADSLEIAEPPRLATTTDLSSPALLGWRRPVVLIPSEYVDALSQERLSHILLHELAHFKRGDAATGFLAFVILATHWFNPLFWLAVRSFFATREEACDAIALGSSALTRPNSAAEYARTLCEIARRRPRVEQAFGTIGFSPTFRSLRRRVETLGRFGTWGRRAAIGCLLASLAASAFATVRLLPDVEKTDAATTAEKTDAPTTAEKTDAPTSAEKTDAPTSDEETSVVRQRARRLFATLPSLPQKPVPPTVAPNDPIAAVDVETLYQDEADRLFFGHSTQERQTFVADAVAKLRSAQTQGEAEYYAALGDYLIRESAFFWLVAGVDAPFRDDAVAASAELPALAEGETPADYPKSVSSTELDAALDRAEKTADPNFRYLAELHRALADDAKRDQPARYRVDYAEPLDAFVRSPFWREHLKPRPCRGLRRELETGAYFLAEAAAQGNGDAAASLARYIENYDVPDFA